MRAFLEKNRNFVIFFSVLLIFKVATFFYIPSWYKVGVGVIMASLVGFYNTSVERQHIGVLLGMILLLFGDAFQLFNNTTFIAIAYIAYILGCVGLITRFRLGIRSYNMPNQPALIGLPILLLVAFVLFSSSYTGSPLIVIASGIGFAALTAFALLRSDKVKGYFEVIIGSFLFGIYGLLQLLKFSGFEFNQSILIVLHAVAAFLIVMGITVGSKLKPAKPVAVKAKKKQTKKKK